MKLKGEAFVMGALPLLDFNRKALKAKTPEEKLELLGLTPPHRNVVINSDYWIASREVTVAQFRAFVEATGYRTDAEEDEMGGTVPEWTVRSSPRLHLEERGIPVR